MDVINYSDINKKELDRFNQRGFGYSDLYVKDGEVYKFFNYLSDEKTKEIEEKLEAIKELQKSYILSPEKKIMDNGVLKGYTTKYIEGETLHSLIRKRDMLKELQTMINVSKNMEDFHNSKGEPNIGDFHFNNIMIDENGNPIFIDIDSCGINGLKSNGVPASLYSYYDFKGQNVQKNQNDDRIALMLSIFNRLNDRDIFTFSHFAYSDYVGTYPFLYDLYPVYVDLKKRGREIPEVPYLHKVLKNYDNK